MDLLNAIGSIASIIGLLATFYTLYKVTNLPAALKQQSRDRQLSELIDRINEMPPDKAKVSISTAREIKALIENIRLYYISKSPWKQTKLKTLLATLEAELDGRKQLGVVQIQLRLIRDEITIR